MAGSVTVMSVREFAKKHPSFSEGSLRWYIQHAEKYKIKEAILRLGGKILIDEKKFFELLQQNSK